MNVQGYSEQWYKNITTYHIYDKVSKRKFMDNAYTFCSQNAINVFYLSCIDLQSIWFLCSVFGIVYWFAAHFNQYHDPAFLGMEKIMPYRSRPWTAFSETVHAVTIAIVTKIILHICSDLWAHNMIHWNVKYKFYNCLYANISHKGILWKHLQQWNKTSKVLTQAQSEVPHSQRTLGILVQTASYYLPYNILVIGT